MAVAKRVVTTFIKKHVHATLVSKKDIRSDSPSLIRDRVSGTRSLEQLECCSTLIWMNCRIWYTCLKNLWEDEFMDSKKARIRAINQKLWLLKVNNVLATSQGLETWKTRFERNPLSQIGHVINHWKDKETSFLEW